MGDFKRCTANSPFCLGMTDFCFCDSDDFIAETNILAKRKQLSLGKPAKKAALLPSKRFEKTISEEEVQKTSKVASLQMLQEALDGHFVPSQFAVHLLKSPFPIAIPDAQFKFERLLTSSC